MKKTKKLLAWMVVPALALVFVCGIALAACSGASKVPGTVEKFTAVAGDSEVVLAWEAPEKDGGKEVQGYKVTRVNTSGDDVVATKDKIQLTHTFGSLTNGQEYTFKVCAFNEVGDGAEKTIKATPAKPLGTPVVTLSADHRISWPNVANATSYTIKFEKGTVLVGETDVTSGATATYVTSYFYDVMTPSNATAGDYKVSVRANNKTNPAYSSSPYSTPKDITFTTPDFSSVSITMALTSEEFTWSPHTSSASMGYVQIWKGTEKIYDDRELSLTMRSWSADAKDLIDFISVLSYGEYKIYVVFGGTGSNALCGYSSVKTFTSTKLVAFDFTAATIANPANQPIEWATPADTYRDGFRLIIWASMTGDPSDPLQVVTLHKSVGSFDLGTLEWEGDVGVCIEAYSNTAGYTAVRTQELTFSL